MRVVAHSLFVIYFFNRLSDKNSKSHTGVDSIKVSTCVLFWSCARMKSDLKKVKFKKYRCKDKMKAYNWNL